MMVWWGLVGGGLGQRGLDNVVSFHSDVNRPSPNNRSVTLRFCQKASHAL